MIRLLAIAWLYGRETMEWGVNTIFAPKRSHAGCRSCDRLREQLSRAQQEAAARKFLLGVLDKEDKRNAN
jgi:hypothetical protein